MTQETKVLERTTGVVRLIGTDQKYHTAPVFLAPRYDEVSRTFTINGKQYKGKEVTENNEKVTIAEGTPIRVTDVDSFRFAHLQSFDMSNEQHRFLLELALGDGMVAASKKEVNNGVHRYYIEDKEREAVDKIGKTQLVFQAMEKIRAMSLEEMQDYGRLFGIHTKDQSRSQLEAALYDLSMESPNKILSVSEDRNSKHKIFLRKAIQHGIVRVVNGKYMNGTELVGANEDYAIEFLRDPQNSALVTQWNKMMKGEKANVEKTA